MITITELKRSAAKQGVALSVVEKDYALTWILCALAESSCKENLIFKGGTALRKIYFSGWRYSEDLDFTTTKVFDESEIRELIKSVDLYLAEKNGMRISMKSLHINPEYAQLKIQFIGPFNHENTIKIDLTFNEIIVLPPEKKCIISEYSDKEKHFLQSYPLEEILAEKIRSILERGKTRDYYDVWKILKFHSQKINKIKIKDVLTKKCLFKNLICNKTLLFEADKIAEVRKYWEKGLAHQINNLPDFKKVVEECEKLLDKFLED